MGSKNNTLPENPFDSINSSEENNNTNPFDSINYNNKKDINSTITSTKINLLKEQTNPFDEVGKSGNEESNETLSDKSYTEKGKGFLSNFFDSDIMDQIQDIEIDGKVENMQEFNEKLSKLIEIIKDDSKFKKLDKINQDKIISGIQKIGSGLEEKTNKTLDFLGDKINSIANQIEKQKEGGINIDIEGQKIKFKSKKEAFAFVKMLKEESENEFQSILTDTGEILGALFINIFSTDLPLLPYQTTRDSIVDGIENYEDNDHWGLLTIDALQVILLTIASVNYTETIYRRLVKDSAGKMGFDWAKIGDFDKERLSYQTGEGNQDKQAKYNRRLDAYNYLKNHLSEIKSENRAEYLKELKNIEGYINIDSKTFWLKFEALRKERGLGGRVVNMFKHGPKYTFWDIERSQVDYINTNHNDSIERIKKGLNYVFINVEVEGNDGKRDIKVSGLTEDLEKMKKYIESIPDSDRRKSTLESFEKYIGNLKDNPKSKEIIKGQLYNILENKFYGVDKMINEIDKRYFKELNIVELERRGYFKWVLQAYDFAKGNLKTFNGSMTKVWGKYAPTSLTYGQALAIKVREEMKNGNIEGNKETLKMIYKKIDSGKLELNSSFPGFKKPLILVKLITSMFGRYGLTVPSISDIRSFGLVNRASSLDDFIEKGGEYEEKIKQAKEFIKGKTVLNLKNIIDLDERRFPSTKETFFEEMFEKLEVSVNEGKLTEEQVKIEIVKMYLGLLTNQEILLEISKLDKNTKKQQNVKEFITEVENNRLTYTKEKLIDIIVELKAGNTIEGREIDFKESERIKKINEKGAELGKEHFRNPRFGIFEGKTDNLSGLKKGEIVLDSYKNIELELSNLLKILNGDSKINLDKLSELFEKINTGTDYTSKKFFAELSKSLDYTFTFNENTKRSGLQEFLKVEIGPKLNLILHDFEKKSIEEKKQAINELKTTLGISNSNLTSSITEALTKVGFYIGNYIDKIVEFNSIQAREQAREQAEKEYKKESRNEIKKKVEFLLNLQIPDTKEGFSAINSSLKEYGVVLEFKLDRRGNLLKNGSKNQIKIDRAIQNLEILKLELLSPKQLATLGNTRILERKLKNIHIELKQLDRSTKTKINKLVKGMKGEIAGLTVEKAKNEFLEKIKELRKIK